MKRLGKFTKTIYDENYDFSNCPECCTVITDEQANGEECYQVYLATGTAWYQVFQVYAYNQTEAVDLVADYCEDNELHGLYSDYYDLADLCESGETVDEYAGANGLTCCGNHGIYLDVAGLEEIK